MKRDTGKKARDSGRPGKLGRSMLRHYNGLVGAEGD
jgi:hypothetical protein